MAVARAYGVSNILAFNRSQKRADFARSLWADYVAVPPIRAKQEDPFAWAESFKAKVMAETALDACGVDVAVDASGAESCMQAGMSFVRPGGTCMSYSPI